MVIKMNTSKVPVAAEPLTFLIKNDQERKHLNGVALLVYDSFWSLTRLSTRPFAKLNEAFAAKTS
jgi:hypothetical protein